jgi:hypothetical protein
MDFVSMEFECLKNEFERNFKKKDKTLSLSLSLSPFLLFQPAPRPTCLFFFPPREQADPSSPTSRTRRPNTALPPFFFCYGR